MKVLFISGHPRSGTTLLDHVLGQMDGFFSVGELSFIWKRGLLRNELCECGNPFRNCAFWNTVFEEGFGSIDKLNAESISNLMMVTDRARFVPFLLIPSLQSVAYRRNFAAYAQVLSTLYGAIHKVSGARVIVDSSKAPSHAFFLRAIPELDSHIVHLVRDSRAVAFSFQRNKLRREVYWTTESITRWNPAKTAVTWVMLNLLASSLKNLDMPYLFLRYEEFASEPQKILRMILRHIDEQIPDLSSFVSARVIDMKIGHMVSGNPDRFLHGKIQIRTDVEWQAKMLKYQKHLVTALTWPLLRQYGYLTDKHSDKLQPVEL